MKPPAEKMRLVALHPAPGEDFAGAAEKARKVGATHVLITEDLPRSFWQLELRSDPYPAWFIHQPGLLKIFPPEAVKPFVNIEYAERIGSILAERCAHLRAHGLKAYYSTNEPQVLPEAFFQAHPELRGPRVDQPNRSRQPHFAPCTDRPEVLALYREAMQQLLERCPEVELCCFLTTDSGAGFCWSPSLYPGRNGPRACASQRMSDRVATFLRSLQAAAKERGRSIEIQLVEIPPRRWMLPTFEDPVAIARQLPPGLAVNNHEGPEGRAFMSGSGLESLWSHAFYPVLGLPRPLAFLRQLVEGAAHPAPRTVLTLQDASNNRLNGAVAAAFDRDPPRDRVAQLALLRQVAEATVGENGANALLECWLLLETIEILLEPLDFGPVLRMGGVLARWINRPLVPYPAALTEAETDYWKPFLFQAKGEAQALNLIDIQGMRMFAGWGARMLVEQTVGQILQRLDRALEFVAPLGLEALSRRLRVLRCLLVTTRQVVAYQAQLERVRAQERSPDPDPVLGTRGSWDREDLLRLARDEIDNALELKALLEGAEDPVLDLAPSAAEETITRLGPDLPAQLQRKAEIMHAHWRDYDRLFTEPNP